MGPIDRFEAGGHTTKPLVGLSPECETCGHSATLARLMSDDPITPCRRPAGRSRKVLIRAKRWLAWQVTLVRCYLAYALVLATEKTLPAGPLREEFVRHVNNMYQS